MKTFNSMSFGCSLLGLLTLTAASASSADLRIVNENYDPPFLANPGGWEYGTVENLSRQYVSTGVARSTALEISASFPWPEGSETVGAGVATTMFQDGLMAGNEGAAPDNTILSFDLKVDSPGLAYVGVFLDAFSEWGWGYWNSANATYSGTTIAVDVSNLKPGVFHKVVLPLNDPRWQPIEIWENGMPTGLEAPFFDPAARTYNNVALVVNNFCLPVPGSFKVTVDNVQISAKTELVPFKATTAGSIVGLDVNGLPVLSEDGVGERIGNFHLDVTFTPNGLGDVTITAANGDKMFGTLYLDGLPPNYVAVEIEDGTGIFKGAKGSYAGMMTWIDQYSWTAAVTGAISSVGLNKK